MSEKIRIYQLAKDLELDYKKILEEAESFGITAKSHASSITAEEAELIKESFKEQKSTVKVQPDKVEKETTKEEPEVEPEIPEKTEDKKEQPAGIEKEIELPETDYEDDLETIERKVFQKKAPIVTVMGHVDHGKTQLLDTIRHTNVIARESGGITQHIGASKLTIKNKGDIIFIDTPGHEAFTAMRARGAQVTDIVVLVIAGDDGVMPQTLEAINHAKAANVPIIVAINKMDLPEYDAEKVRTQLSQHDILTESWGGDIISIEVSAKANKNIDELLEMILLQAEMLELKAPVDGPAEGIIIESGLDKQIGPTGTLIIEKGTLAVGDSFVCGTVWGKVKAMIDESVARLITAGPSTPVKILGFNELPQTGNRFNVQKDKVIWTGKPDR